MKYMKTMYALDGWTKARWKWRTPNPKQVYTIPGAHIHLLLVIFGLMPGNVGGLTDLTGAAAANGLLVGLSGDHLDSNKNIYGSHLSNNILSPYNENNQGSAGGAPIWRIEPPRSSVFSNSTGARVECVATGIPPPSIEWYQEDQLITHNIHGLRIVMTNGTLVFPPFKGEQYREDVHTGTYHCQARNKYGVILSRTVEVHGVVDLDFAVSVHDAYAIRGNTAVLRCEIPPEVRDYVRVTSWLHEEGTAIEIFPEKEPRGKYTLLDQTGGHLLVHHTSTYDTYKKYICKTEHKLTGIRRRSLQPARLILTEPKGTILPLLVEPRVDKLTKIQRHAWVGDNVLLPCVAQGFPVPETTWFRVEGVGLRQVLPTPKVKYHLEVLILQELTVEDSGVYVCIVNNTVGSERVEVNLTVRSPLGVNVEPATQIIDLNRQAVFSCSVVGWPVESTSWYKNGYPLHVSHRYQTIANGTLRINSVQEGDEGSYQCVVRNDGDSAQATGSLLLGDAMPALLYKFSEQTLQPGPSVSLKCIAKGNPPPSVEWSLDGFPIQRSDRHLIGQYVTIHDDVISHMNISEVESIDGGAYTCKAINTVGTVTHTARINVYGPPMIRSTPTVKAIEGQRLQVACPASGYPIEQITWQKDGYEMPSDPTRQKVFTNGTMIIEKASKVLDEGYYTCAAFGNQRKESNSGTVQIQVLTPPNIMPFLFPNKVLTEGMRSAVSCQILEGNLPIKFHWEKNGRELYDSSYNGDKRKNLMPYHSHGGGGGKSSNSIQMFDSSNWKYDSFQQHHKNNNKRDSAISIRSNDEYSSTLIIDRLEFNHRGNYTCTASNAAGMSFHTAELKVNVPPKWIQEPRDVQAIVGQDITLPCSVDGFPKPSTVWTRTNDFGANINYQVLPLGLSFNQLPNGSLSIASVTKATEGMYTCTAQNGVRTGISKTINVTVNAPPSFDEKTVRLSVRKGEKANLICEASGDSPMDVFWRRNGMPISENEDARFTMLEHKTKEDVISRFIINPVLDQDGGQITCEAANRYGRDQKNFLLSIEDVPSPPSGVRLANIKSRSLEISWIGPHDGNSPILNYVIEYSNLPDQRDQGEKQRRKMTASGEAKNLAVQNLRPGTRYKFRVSAENRHGMSQESQAVTTRMMEEAPTSQPRNLQANPISSTELEIVWEAPPLAQWNSELLNYKIGYKEVGRTEEMSYINLQPSNSLSERFVLGGRLNFRHQDSLSDMSEFFQREEGVLKKYTSYQISVTPYNKQGIGPASSSVVATTKEDTPSGSPTNVHCQSRSPNSILLEWSKPKREERNGIIRGYWIEYYPRTLWYETNGRLQTKETEGEMLEVDGLDVFTNYSISVSAFTRAGKGKPSSQIYCRTSEDVPSAPADIKVVTSGDTSSIVSWRAPALPNGIIQKYTVYRREVINGQEVDVRQSSVLSGPNYLELSGLQASRRYDIWVKAETSAGYGPSSKVTSVILSNSVRPRIVSFGEILAAPWKSDLVLDCLHVGEPSPKVLWSHQRKPVLENSKHQIFPNGSLSVRRLTETDQGDYTCTVKSGLTDSIGDRIVYELIVQTPPVAPVLSIENITYTAIQISWRGARSRKQPVLGYTVNYRREHGPWRQTDIHPLTGELWLDSNMKCGNNYTIYMTSYNHVGPGHASSVLAAKTLGRVPDIPNPSDLLVVNKTFIALHLNAFGDGGCPILYFVIEYRRDSGRGPNSKYIMVANNVRPRERAYSIRGLDPASRYYIKVTAHNSAGSSIAEYPFATLTSQGHHIPPPISGTIDRREKYAIGINSHEESGSSNNPNPIATVIKVVSTVFLSACLIVSAFYFAIFYRKWKLKRDLDGLSNGHDGSRSGSMQFVDHFASVREGFMGSMSGRAHFRRPFPMRTSPILSARFRKGILSKHDNRNNDLRDDDDQRSFAPTSFNTLERRSGGNGSPILQPFKSSDTLFTAEGLGGSATSSAGGGSFETGLADGGFLSNTMGQDGDEALAWNRANIESCDNNVDEVVCPYATFQLSREQQIQLNQQQQQQLNTNINLQSNGQFGQELPPASSGISSSLAILQPQPARPAPVFNPCDTGKVTTGRLPTSSCSETISNQLATNMSNAVSSCAMTIPQNTINGISSNGLNQNVSGNNPLETNGSLNTQDSKCDINSTLKRTTQKQQGSHPLAALGSFFTGGKNNAGGNVRAEDLGSDGMSGSGSASGSSGVNNSTINNGIRTPKDNVGFIIGSNTCVMNNHPSMIPNNTNVEDNGMQNNNLVMPLAAVHAAMASATLDRQFRSSWRHQLGHHPQIDPLQCAIPSFGRPFVRNNSLGHAILPSQSQNTIPYAIDPKYDSDSDFDYRQRPPRPYKPKRLKGKRSAKLTSKSSSSSTSDDDSPDSVSPIPRVRSIEALEFLTHAKQQRMAAMMMMHQQQQQQQINSNSKTGSQNFQKPQHQTTNHFTPNNLQLQNNAKSQHRQPVQQQQVSFQLQDFHQAMPHIHHQHMHHQGHHPGILLHQNQHQVQPAHTFDRSQHEATTNFMLDSNNAMVQPPMGFLDVQSHPLIFRRSQSREALEGLNQQQGVSTFQIHTKRNASDNGGHYQQIGKHQVLPMMEVRTLGRPQTKKRGQNLSNLSTPDTLIPQTQQHAQV